MALRDLGREILLFGIGAALAVIVGGLLLSTLVMPAVTRQGMQIEVPDVVGTSPDQARAILSASRLRIQVEEERFSQDVPVDHIVFQRPRAHSKVKEDRTVYITVSRGDTAYQVPDLTVGISAREAMLKLEQAGISVGAVEEVATEAPVGMVVGQRPEPGALVPRGSLVDLIVSLGPNPAVRTPDLMGWALDSAYAVLDSLGLSAGHIRYLKGAAGGSGKIFGQMPKPGVEVHAGDRVDLIVGQ